MTEPRKRMLLMVAAALAVLRFLVVPWLGAQGEARERLEVLTQRLDRSTGVVQNREAILAARKSLRASTQAVLERFPSATGADAFRLDSQRSLGALVSAAGGQMTLFDWLLDGRLPDTGLSYGRVRFAVEGALRDLVRVHGDVEGSMPNLVVREMTLNLVSPGQGPDTTRGTLTVVGDLFFRAKANASAANAPARVAPASAAGAGP